MSKKFLAANTSILLISVFLICLVEYVLDKYLLLPNHIFMPRQLPLSVVVDIVILCALPALITVAAYLSAAWLFAFKKLIISMLNILPITFFVVVVIAISNVFGDAVYDFSERDFFSFTKPIGSAFVSPNIARVLLAVIVATVTLALLKLIFSEHISLSFRAEKLSGKEIVSIATFSLLLCLAVLIFRLTNWLSETFTGVDLTSIITQLNMPIAGTDTAIVSSGIWGVAIPSALTLIAAVLASVLFCKIRIKLAKPIFKQKRLKGIKPALLALPIPLLVSSIVTFNNEYDLTGHIARRSEYSTFFDTYFVDPRDVTITFPEQNRNLIYIFLESVETTFLSYELGGAFEVNKIPELSELIQNHVSFSHTDRLGGARQIAGTDTTTTAMVSHHVGVPLLLDGFGIHHLAYGEHASFLPGAYSLGDILNRQSYNQTLIVGSDASFGGRRNFFEQRGGYRILDWHTAQEDGIIPHGYRVWWGFEDWRLFEYAKMELDRLSAMPEPFNLTILTVDTHATGGWRCIMCPNIHDDQYWDVMACQSNQVARFVVWLEAQDFFENTTIIIASDHLSMDGIVVRQAPEGFQRSNLNIFINSQADVPAGSSVFNNRDFATFDMLPTTLAAMGIAVEGERLGLGINLFSGLPTILELYEVGFIVEELAKPSITYNSLFFEN